MDNEVDQISFFDGDRIGECRVLRRTDGDRRCILSMFTIRRGTGRLDAFISGAGGVKAKLGVTEEFLKGFFDDMRVAAAENDRLIGLRTSWESVDLTPCSTMAADVEAIKKAGVPMWSRTKE
jgi:hypothetical protein